MEGFDAHFTGLSGISPPYISGSCEMSISFNKVVVKCLSSTKINCEKRINSLLISNFPLFLSLSLSLYLPTCLYIHKH